jgi:hypothetical protein
MRILWCVIIVAVGCGIALAVTLNNSLSDMHWLDSGAMSAIAGSWPKPAVTLTISLLVHKIMIGMSTTARWCFDPAVLFLLSLPGRRTGNDRPSHHCWLTSTRINSVTDGGFCPASNYQFWHSIWFIVPYANIVQGQILWVIIWFMIGLLLEVGRMFASGGWRI